MLKYFESASGIKLNAQKTKIFGFGSWQGRTVWPYELKVEVSKIDILGVTYTHDIKQSINISWTDVITKIKRHISLLKCRNRRGWFQNHRI